MMGMIQDKKFKGIMMWLVCILSLALCLHSNSHVAATSQFQNISYYTTAVHSHQHEVNQPHKHSHQDAFYEHFIGYDSSNNLIFTILIFSCDVFDSVKHYSFLVMSRIFKPPKN